MRHCSFTEPEVQCEAVKGVCVYRCFGTLTEAKQSGIFRFPLMLLSRAASLRCKHVLFIEQDGSNLTRWQTTAKLRTMGRTVEGNTASAFKDVRYDKLYALLPPQLRTIPIQSITPRYGGPVTLRNQIITALHHYGPMCDRDLSKKLGIEHETLAPIRRRLVLAGVVEEHDEMSPGIFSKHHNQKQWRLVSTNELPEMWRPDVGQPPV